MTHTQRVLAATLFGTSVFFGACGDGAKAPAGAGASATGAGIQAPPAVVVVPAPPSEMLALLPEGTAAFAYIASAQALEDGARRIAASVAPRSAAGVNLAALAASFTAIDPADIDMTQGAMIAVTFAPGADVPGMTAILGVRDPAATVAQIEAQMPGVPTDTAGRFVAVTPTRGYKRGGRPSWAAGPLPAGDIVIRLDVPTLMRTLGPTALAAVNASLDRMGSFAQGQPGMQDPSVAARQMVNGLKSAMDEAGVWDLALRSDGTAIEADLMMRWKPSTTSGSGSIFANADLATLARGVPADGMVTIAMGYDARRLFGAAKGFMDALASSMPDAQADMMAKAWQGWAKMSDLIGPGQVASMGLTSNGMEMAAVTQTTDGAAFMQAFSGMAANLGGEGGMLKMAAREPRVVEGIDVAGWTGTVDYEKATSTTRPGLPPADQRKVLEAIYGAQGMQMSVANLGKTALTVLGGEAAVARAVKAAKSATTAAPDALSRAITAAGPDTVGYLSVDMRALNRGFSALLPQPESGPQRPTSHVPAGDPVPVTMILNAPPGALRGRLSMDIGKLVAMFKSATPK